MYIYVCLCECMLSVCPSRSKEGVRSTCGGVTGGCELPSRGAGNRTWILQKSSKYSLIAGTSLRLCLMLLNSLVRWHCSSSIDQWIYTHAIPIILAFGTLYWKIEVFSFERYPFPGWWGGLAGFSSGIHTKEEKIDLTELFSNLYSYATACAFTRTSRHVHPHIGHSMYIHTYKSNVL